MRILLFLLIATTIVAQIHGDCICGKCRSTNCCVRHYSSCTGHHGSPSNCCSNMFCCKTHMRDDYGQCKYREEC